jgi:hypothetical protein
MSDKKRSKITARPAFLVSGTLAAGGASFQEATPVTALDKSIELVGLGYQGVTIWDERGTIFNPDEFDRFYNVTRK